MKTLNEVYKLSDEDLRKYHANLFAHYQLVKEEVIRRAVQKGNGIR
jgi:hypothetical protein